MSLNKEQKDGLLNNTNLCFIQANALLVEVMKKKELSKTESNAMLVASNASLTIAVATLVQAIILNMDESLILKGRIEAN